MVRARPYIVAIFITLVSSFGCTHQKSSPSPHEAVQPIGHATVLWISVDGLRGDYVGRAKPTFLSKLVREGQSTTQLTPVFPSLTFPSHISEATGVPPGVHGITGNAFYDTATEKAYSFPDDASLVRAEPIWITAERQGVRTAVIDWPMSQKQSGPVKSAYFNAGYDSSLSDADRIAKLVQVYRDDHDPNPLRLLMGYVHAVDTAGHKFGPDSPLVDDALRETDKLLEQVVSDVERAFDEKAKPGDELYVLISTDHGMLAVKNMVNLETLLNHPNVNVERIVTSGSIAQIYFTPVGDDLVAFEAQNTVDRLKSFDFLRVWKRADLPPEYHYANPARTGDVVVVCKPGYSFTSRPGEPRPALPADVKGMHGYDPAECPEMRGFCALWKYRKVDRGNDLGTISSLQLHSTVASLLGIQPNSCAKADSIKR